MLCCQDRMDITVKNAIPQSNGFVFARNQRFIALGKKLLAFIEFAHFEKPPINV
ncbi:hypothetical protein D3C78_1106870 [compost metagenome]